MGHLEDKKKYYKDKADASSGGKRSAPKKSAAKKATKKDA